MTERSTSDSLDDVSWIQKTCTEGMCHSSTHPSMSYHVTQFYQAFPRVSNASDKHWGEKAWVRGYSGSTHVLGGQLLESKFSVMKSIVSRFSDMSIVKHGISQEIDSNDSSMRRSLPVTLYPHKYT